MLPGLKRKDPVILLTIGIENNAFGREIGV